jgi:Tol biopolymer transport system component
MRTVRLVSLAVVGVVLAGMALAAAQTSNATFKGRNGLLLYQAQVGANTQLFTIGPDGSGATQITHFKDRSATDGKWAPDGSRIVFTQQWDPAGPNEHFLLSTMNADGTGLRTLPKTGKFAVSPNWLGPRSIGFLDAAGAHGGVLKVINTNGTALRRVRVPGIGPFSACALRGNRVAYLAANPANGDLSAIYVSGLSGRGGKRVTAWGAYADKIDCAPSGARIVFSKPGFDSGLPSNVYTMRTDGSDLVQLTHETGDTDAGADSWSPDGTKIAYVSNKSGSYQIWTMNADGTGQKQLTKAADAHLAAWGSHP